MRKEVLEKMIREDDQGLLDIKSNANYRIYGREKGKRGGAFFGVVQESGRPEFGGSNLIYAPVWWNTTYEAVLEICDKLLSRFPDCEFSPEKIS